MSRTRSILAVTTATLLAAAATAATPALVPYPTDYREWTHVKSMWIGPEHGLADPFAGLHHIYVNPTGEKALRDGEPLPDGTVLVFDLLEGNLADHAVAEGPRKFVGVMQKDAKKWAATGGWGFEAFAGDSKTERVVTDGGVGCFGCHEAQAPNGYVFTTWRP